MFVLYFKHQFQKYIDEHKFGLKRLDALSGRNVVKNKVEEHLCDIDFCYLYVFMKYNILVLVFNSFNPDNLYAYYGDTANHQTVEMIKFVPAPSSLFMLILANWSLGTERLLKTFLKNRPRLQRSCQ